MLGRQTNSLSGALVTGVYEIEALWSEGETGEKTRCFYNYWLQAPNAQGGFTGFFCAGRERKKVAVEGSVSFSLGQHAPTINLYQFNLQSEWGGGDDGDECEKDYSFTFTASGASGPDELGPPWNMAMFEPGTGECKLVDPDADRTLALKGKFNTAAEAEEQFAVRNRHASRLQAAAKKLKTATCTIRRLNAVSRPLTLAPNIYLVHGVEAESYPLLISHVVPTRRPEKLGGDDSDAPRRAAGRARKAAAVRTCPTCPTASGTLRCTARR